MKFSKHFELLIGFLTRNLTSILETLVNAFTSPSPILLNKSGPQNKKIDKSVVVIKFQF